MKACVIYSFEGRLSRDVFLAINHNRKCIIRKKENGHCIAVPISLAKDWIDLFGISAVTFKPITNEDIELLKDDTYGAPLGFSLH